MFRRKQEEVGKYLFDIRNNNSIAKKSSVARDDERASDENEWGNYWPERFLIRGERKTKYVKCLWISALGKDLQILLFVSCCYSSCRLLLLSVLARSGVDLSSIYMGRNVY